MATKTEDRNGTLAKARGIRMSASKARIVLDLIRGKHVTEAAHILEFSERLAAEPILKVLRSAIANAVHNDELNEDELYVSECYADGGPTLKRFRPRARGRAGRIQKKTCHITVVVARLSEEDLEAKRAHEERQAEKSSATSKKSDAATRRKRVAKSKPKSDDAVAEKEAVENEPQDAVEAEESPVDEVVPDDAAEDAAEATSEEEE